MQNTNFTGIIVETHGRIIYLKNGLIHNECGPADAIIIDEYRLDGTYICKRNTDQTVHKKRVDKLKEKDTSIDVSDYSFRPRSS